MFVQRETPNAAMRKIICAAFGCGMRDKKTPYTQTRADLFLIYHGQREICRPFTFFAADETLKATWLAICIVSSSANSRAHIHYLNGTAYLRKPMKIATSLHLLLKIIKIKPN